MIAALDLGSSEFRSLRREGQRLIARRIPAVYTVLEDLPSNRRVLEQSHTAYSASGGSLIIVGESAVEISTLLSRPLVPLLIGGRLADQDPIGRQVCAWLIELLLPPAREESDFCLMTLPRGDRSEHGATGWTSQFLEHIVQLHGYQTDVMCTTEALALAELEDQEFSGICLTVGAEAIHFGVVRQSQVLIDSRYLKGSRDLIERFAHARKKFLWDADGNAYLNLPLIQNWLTHGDLNLSAPQSDDEAWLAEAYAELLLSAMFSVKRKLMSSPDSLLQQPLPVVVSGGAARLPGFSQIVSEAIQLSHLPLQIKSIRTAAFEPFSIARGLLIRATLSRGEVVDEMLAVEAA